MMTPENDEKSSFQPIASISDPQQMLEALRWQVEMGADEAILDHPEPLAAHSSSSSKTDELSLTKQPLVSDNPDDITKPQDTPNPDHLDPVIKTPSIAAKASGKTLDVAHCATLDALRQAVENYDGSELKRTATQMVFADGDPASKIMFIGEAPGADEDRQGKPFVGVSGQLLNQMLASIGLLRDTIYITNIILWRPPGNRTPTSEETAQFLPILRRHIQLVQPDVLVCLGGAAAKGLLATDLGILKLRGSWHHYDAGDGRELPVMPTLHPAYL
ncbi:MAG: uracil-DNA glycosylase, partial [Proteobacteria bacterium]|nr:uracil-DNA glycosylase [Pseudomonadota bacterium]